MRLAVRLFACISARARPKCPRHALSNCSLHERSTWWGTTVQSFLLFLVLTLSSLLSSLLCHFTQWSTKSSTRATIEDHHVFSIIMIIKHDQRPASCAVSLQEFPAYSQESLLDIVTAVELAELWDLEKLAGRMRKNNTQICQLPVDLAQELQSADALEAVGARNRKW